MSKSQIALHRTLPDGPAKPRVSVVMTTFNAERHVAEAVRSIVSQTLAAWELLVVDDGSTDATLDTVAALGDPRVRILRIPRCGRIPSLNHGFEASRSPLVAVQDADDVSRPDRLRLQVEEMERRPALGLLGAGIVPQIDEEGKPLGERTRPVGAGKARRELGRAMAFFHSSVMYRKAAWAEAGRFDETLPCWEDYDMAVRISAHHEVDNLPVALALKRRHAGQAFDAIHFTTRGYRARARILLRYARTVRHDPVVLARAAAYMAMGPRLRIAWLRATGRDQDEVALHKQIRR